VDTPSAASAVMAGAVLVAMTRIVNMTRRVDTGRNGS
jgi:hypothetical protein